jgi:hypothetical protein
MPGTQKYYERAFHTVIRAPSNPHQGVGGLCLDHTARGQWRTPAKAGHAQVGAEESDTTLGI